MQMARVKQKTPAQAQRYKLTAAIRDRGEKGTNIWLVRPPFQTRDLFLSSDPQFEAFYLLEGEPAFREIRYLSQWYDVQPVEQLWRPLRQFAVVTTVDDQELSVELAFEAESPKGSAAASLRPFEGVVRVNVDMLNQHIQRIENWRRIIPCIRRVRLHATAAVERQIAIFLHKKGRITLRNLHGHFSDVDVGIFYGAIATLLRKRELCADLDTRPWSLNTCVWNAEV